MSGHSKWANIKNKKAKGDAARANVFTKIGRELAIYLASTGLMYRGFSAYWDKEARS